METDTVSTSVEERIIGAIRAVIGDRDEFVPLHKPTFEGNEWNYVKECIDTEWVSSVGSYVDRFEEDLADYTGAKRAVVVVNGTSALHVCLRLAGVEAGDEVLAPALTFVATANAVACQGATPHFVDSEKGTLGLDPAKLGDAVLLNVKFRGEARRRTGLDFSVPRSKCEAASALQRR